MRHNKKSLPEVLIPQEIIENKILLVRGRKVMLDRDLAELYGVKPDKFEKELWRGVVFSRFEIKLKSPAPWDPPTEELLKEMESMDQIMTNIHSWEDVLEFILQMDKDAFSFDSSGIQNKINDILSE